MYLKNPGKNMNYSCTVFKGSKNFNAWSFQSSSGAVRVWAKDNFADYVIFTCNILIPSQVYFYSSAKK